jgi:hypothetical protein
MPKTEGGLGLFDLKARNRSFIGKQLWNIHLKTDSVWIRWIHHFYLRSGIVWSVQTHSSSSPLWKVILSVRDLLSQHCGDSEVNISLMSQWSFVAGPFLHHAYNFFRPIGSVVSWNRVVWE